MIRNYGHNGFPILFYGNNVEELNVLLFKYPVKHQTKHLFSIDTPQALVDVIDNLTQPEVVMSIAGAFTAWLGYKSRRSVKITLKDGRTIEGKAISAKEFAKYLESATQIIAIDDSNES